MMKALVIDDSRAIRSVLSRILGQCGFEVCQAENGKIALEVLDRESPGVSLVLADWNMPEMDGLEFTKRMRQDARYDSVPLMMVTTETHIELMVKALDAGANEYMMKPFTPESITEKLRILGLVA